MSRSVAVLVAVALLTLLSLTGLDAVPRKCLFLTPHSVTLWHSLSSNLKFFPEWGPGLGLWSLGVVRD